MVGWMDDPCGIGWERQRSEVGGLRTGRDRGQKSEVREQRTENREQRTENREQRTDDR